jgi:NADP-dependent alcohol dehydrogenase
MQNFTFHNPTRVHFGKGQIARITQEIPKNAKVLLLYGGGSIKKNGVYDQVTAALKSFTVFEFSGIEPNPEYDTLMQAVALIKREKIDFVLAVGGGSVIDGCKFIVAAVPFNGEPWDILEKQAPIEFAVPYGCVLTLPATGSEINASSVVSRRSIGAKLYFTNNHVYPQFAILDPETTYTMPIKQVANGVVDAFTHVMEQYLTYPDHAPLQDRFAEGILQTLIEEGPKALQHPKDYTVRSNIMWCATLALNGLIGAGVPQDWTTHMLGHELTAKYGLDHAQTLAIVLPNVMHYKKTQKHAKLLQYASRVWGLSTGSEAERITQAIAKTRQFFETMGVKTRLQDYGVKADIIALVNNLAQYGRTALGEHQDIHLKDSETILAMCA